jgi:ribosomal-protein-alanine N-acetyltransferase
MIQPYQPKDKFACIRIFDSNCPKYFAPGELDLFIEWLENQGGSGLTTYQSPTYRNASHDAYYVLNHPEHGIIGCGGFYIKDKPAEARLAWGMVHADHQGKGHGSELYRYRLAAIRSRWPQHHVTLGTSQHTYPFYEKMGMKVITSFRNGYGPGIDRYDMVLPLGHP